MAQQVRNVTNIIINAEDAALSTVAGDGAGPAGLNVGEVGVFSADGLRVVNAGAAAGEIDTGDVTSFFLARGSATAAADGYHKTDIITVADITNASCSVLGVAGSNAAATEQQDSIGYNGTSGSIEAINNNLYLVSIYVQEYLTSSTDGRRIKHFQYHSDATATQAEIAIGLVGSAVNNFSKEATQYMTFEAFCDDAGVANGLLTGTLTATNGSKTVLAATAIDGDGQVVGDFWRAGLTTTDDVYRIVSLDTTAETMVLDRAYQGATTTHAAVATETITAALGAAADWGVDLQGQPLDFLVGKLFYKKTRWESSLKNFGTTSSAREGNATKGQSNGHDILETEWFMSGFEGEEYRMGEPAIYPFTATADGTLHYGNYAIGFNDSSLVGFENNISPKMLLIAIPTNAGVPSANTPANAVSLTADSVTQVLDALLGTGTSLFI